MADRNTALFKQMQQTGFWDDDEAILETIEEMRQRVKGGENVVDVLAEEGLEPDNALDLA